MQAVRGLLDSLGQAAGGRGGITFSEFRRFFLLLPKQDMLVDYWLRASCPSACDIGARILMRDDAAPAKVGSLTNAMLYCLIPDIHLSSMCAITTCGLGGYPAERAVCPRSQDVAWVATLLRGQYVRDHKMLPGWPLCREGELKKSFERIKSHVHVAGEPLESLDGRRGCRHGQPDSSRTAGDVAAAGHGRVRMQPFLRTVTYSISV